MELSLWMIADRLRDYKPSVKITQGTVCIKNARICVDNVVELHESLVAIGRADKLLPDAAAPDSIVLVSGPDYIALTETNMDKIVNDVLTAFDYYNNWELQLLDAAGYKDFQRMIDISEQIFGNPVLLADASGKLIGLSTCYGPDDINELWRKIYDERAIPIATLSKPFRMADGAHSEGWSFEPEEYIMTNGTKNLGQQIAVDGEVVAAFSIWEHLAPFHPGLKQLVKVFCNIMAEAISSQGGESPLRPYSVILHDLLAEKEVDDVFLDKIAQQYAPPWRVIAARNFFRKDAIHRNGLVEALRKNIQNCIPLIYGDAVVVFLRDNDLEAVTNIIQGLDDITYFSVGVSLYFTELKTFAVRYKQAEHAMEQSQHQLGIFYCEDYALQYILRCAGQYNLALELTHPALNVLRRYDADNQMELYETLFQFLRHERSWVKCAHALHIHRNSLMYRMQRIISLLQINLDDPEVRSYLLLSYLLESSQKATTGNRVLIQH